MTLAGLLEDQYRPIRLLGRSPRTVTLYRHSVALFSRSLGRPALVADLTDRQVSEHLGRLLDLGYSRASVAKERAQLLAFANFAARHGHLTHWLEVGVITVPQTIPEARTIDDLRKLVEHLKHERRPVDGVPGDVWWVSLHLAMWDTAERITALLSARWDDFNGEYLLIRAAARKGSRRDKLYRLSPDCLEWLERARKPPRELIWPWRRSTGHLYYMYSRILAASIGNKSGHKFHAIRRSVASYMKKAGVDPREQLDHSNPRTTIKYLDPRIVGTVEPRDVIDRIG